MNATRCVCVDDGESGRVWVRQTIPVSRWWGKSGSFYGDDERCGEPLGASYMMYEGRYKGWFWFNMKT